MYLGRNVTYLPVCTAAWVRGIAGLELSPVPVPVPVPVPDLPLAQRRPSLYLILPMASVQRRMSSAPRFPNGGVRASA